MSSPFQKKFSLNKRKQEANRILEKFPDKIPVIVEQGKSDKLGRPLIYITSMKFMDYFGINNLNELPTIQDFSEEENMIGDESK